MRDALICSLSGAIFNTSIVLSGFGLFESVFNLSDVFCGGRCYYCVVRSLKSTRCKIRVRIIQDGVCICSSNTKRIYTNSSEALRRPWDILEREPNVPLVYRYLGICFLKIAVRRNDAIFKYQSSFDNPDDRSAVVQAYDMFALTLRCLHHLPNVQYRT